MRAEKILLELLINICKVALETQDDADKSKPISMENWNIGAARNMCRNLKMIL